MDRSQRHDVDSTNRASGMVAATALLLLTLLLVVLSTNGAFQPVDAIGIAFPR
jgi:hypothetical protein